MRCVCFTNQEAAAWDRARDTQISVALTRAGAGCLHREFADNALPRLLLASEEIEVSRKRKQKGGLN